MNTLEEINWKEVTSIYTEGIPRLLRHAEPTSVLSIILWSDSNGGFNFDAYQKLDDGSKRRLGDDEPEWGEQFCHLDETFEEVSEQLADEDDYDSLDLRIRQTLRDVAQALDLVTAAPAGVTNVNWTIQE